MINILKKLSSKLDKSTNPFIIIISFLFLFLGKIVFKYKKILELSKCEIKKFDNRVEYYYKGQFHREDDPTCEFVNGDKYWYEYGELHRLNGPAVERENGYKAWYQNGKYHREDGPAIEYINGSKVWYKNGKFHRIGGPAAEWVNGSKEWYIEGQKYTEEEYNKKIEELYKPEIKVYIDKDYISSLEDWDERFNNNFTKRNKL